MSVIEFFMWYAIMGSVYCGYSLLLDYVLGSNEKKET